MRILYSGGGTMGSVSPLVALHQRLKDASAGRLGELWVGTKDGVEEEIVKKENIPFKSITAGKLRRYFDLQNIIDIFKSIIGFFEALVIILKFQPDVIVSAGSFVSVPVVWAGWFNGVSCIIHQQDVQPGLANKLTAWFAKKITVALDVSLKDFPKDKTVLVGNPIRKIQDTINPVKLRHGAGNKQEKEKFKFKNSLAVLLVIGGGTGALSVNKLIWESLDELTKICNIIHITGKGKNQEARIKNQGNYESFEFLGDEIFDVIQIVDLVISRAGMSALTELAYFKKPCIIIPLPNSHQIKNAEYFASQNACVYLKQDELDSKKLVKQIKDLIDDKDKKESLSKNINKMFIDYSGEKIINIIKNLK